MHDLPIIIFSEEKVSDSAGQCDCDCDCACALPPFEQVNGDISSQVTDFYVSPYESLPLDSEYHICFGPWCKPAVLNQQAISFLDAVNKESLLSAYSRLAQTQGGMVADTFMGKLTKAGFLTNADGEKGSATTLLTAWLHVTDRCNFRCEYCYLPHQPVDMALQTGMQIIGDLFVAAQKRNYKTVKIKYAGGEPFLQFQNILDWHSFSARTAEASRVGLEEIILSNGTLITPEIAVQIRENNMRLMISLDGLHHDHNIHRRFEDKSDTFEQTINAIFIAQSAGLSPHISVTISNQNAPHLSDLASWLLDHDLAFSLNFARSNSYYTQLEDNRELTDGMLAAFEIIKSKLPKKSMLGGLIDRANLVSHHTYTCSAERDYLVYTPQGKLTRCQMDMATVLSDSNEKDVISRIRNIPNPINIPVNEKRGCNSCKWRHWCTGGCPLLSRNMNGSSNLPSPYCKAYKTLIPEAFRLEGYRLLKYKQ